MRNINNLRYADDTTLMAENEEILQSLMKVERGEWKSWLETQLGKNWSWHLVPSLLANRRGISGRSDSFLFLGFKITADSDCSHEIQRCLLLGRKAMANLDSRFKKQRHHFADKGPYNQSYGFSSSRVWMWELGHKEGWVPKNWCFQIVVLEKTLESPSDFKEIKPIQS